MRELVLCEPFSEHATRLDDALRHLRLSIGIEPTAQSEEMNILVEVDEPQHLDDARLEFGGVGDACLPIVYPIGGDIILAVSRPARLLDRARTRLIFGEIFVRCSVR